MAVGAKQTASEKSIVNSIMAWVKAQPLTWAMVVHGGPYQVAGVPDIIGVHKSVFFGIEVKRPGQKPTKIQKHMMSLLEDAGAEVTVATSVQDVERWWDAFVAGDL